MTDRALSLLILILAGFGWFSTGVLVNAVRKGPRIGALTERAAIGVLLGVFVTIYGVAAYNSDAAFIFLPQDVVRILVRGLVLVLGLIPVYWVYLYLTGKLGGSGE